MALDDQDNFVVEKNADSKLYKVAASLLQKRLLDGDANNQNLVWSGSTWVPGTIDGGVYATIKAGIVNAVGIDAVGTGYPNGIGEYPTERITGEGSGLTVEVRYSADVWTPGYLYVKAGGEGYQVGDQLRVLGGSNNKIIEVTGVYDEARSVDIY